MPRDWYVEGGAIGGDGSEGSPLPGLQEVLAAGFAEGDTIYATGPIANQHGADQRHAVLIPGSIPGGRLLRWPGRPRPVLIGALRYGPDRWRQATKVADPMDTAEGVYYCDDADPSILDSRTVTHVSYRWEIDLDEEGRHAGFLYRAATRADMEATPGTWFQAGSGDDPWRVYVHLPAGSPSPLLDAQSALDIEMALNGGGIWLSDCTGWLVRGVDVRHFLAAPTVGDTSNTAVRTTGGTGCVFEDVRVWNCSTHAFSIAGGSGSDIRLVDCLAAGGTDGTLAVHFANSGEVTGRTIEGTEFLVHGLIAWDHAPLYGGATMAGVATFAHISDVGVLGSIRIERCVFRGYADFPNPSVWRSTNGIKTGLIGKADPDNPDDYAVLLRDCLAYGMGGGMTLAGNVGASVALDRCYLDLRNATPAQSTIWTVGWSGAATVLLRSCAIVGAAVGASGSALLRMGTTSASVSSLRIVNCLLHDAADLALQLVRVAHQTSTSILRVRNTVFSAVNPARRVFLVQAASGADAWLAGANVSFENNWWTGTVPSDRAAYNTEAEWRAGIETSAGTIFSTDLDVANLASGDVLPLPGGALRTTLLDPPDPDGPAGIGGSPYAGNYGPWQWPPDVPTTEGCRYRSRGRDPR